jgi:catalase-peroxidase
VIGAGDIAALKSKIIESGLSGPELVSTAWASAATFRGTDMRGGANGARIRLAPQNEWPANNPQQLSRVLATLEGIQQAFNEGKGKQVSLADLIVLGGNTAIEQAAKAAGYDIAVPFTPGRTDALAAQTDARSFAVLEPHADGFRNYFAASNRRSPPEMLVERADLLTLSVPEMTALVGGMRALNANYDQSATGILTAQPGVLDNAFFVNLLDMSTKWNKSPSVEGLYEGRDRDTGELKWTASSVDLIFGSNSELRAVAEVYAADDGGDLLVNDFVESWTKVMNLDRYDVK